MINSAFNYRKIKSLKSWNSNMLQLSDVCYHLRSDYGNPYVTANTLVDISGNNNIGIISSVNSNVLEYNNNVFYLSNHGPYIHIPTLGFNQLSEDFTVIAHVLNNGTSQKNIFSWGNGGISPYYTFIIGVANNKLYFQIYNVVSYVKYSNVLIPDNTYAFISVGFNQLGSLQINVNGEEEYILIGTSPLIRNRGASYNRSFIGRDGNESFLLPSVEKIQTVKIYTKLLSSSEVMAEYSSFKKIKFIQ